MTPETLLETMISEIQQDGWLCAEFERSLKPDQSCQNQELFAKWLRSLIPSHFLRIYNEVQTSIRLLDENP